MEDCVKVTVPTTLESPLKAAIAYNKLACVSIEVSDRGQSYNDEKKKSCLEKGVLEMGVAAGVKIMIGGGN